MNVLSAIGAAANPDPKYMRQFASTCRSIVGPVVVQRGQHGVSSRPEFPRVGSGQGGRQTIGSPRIEVLCVRGQASSRCFDRYGAAATERVRNGEVPPVDFLGRVEDGPHNTMRTAGPPTI